MTTFFYRSLSRPCRGQSLRARVADVPASRSPPVLLGIFAACLLVLGRPTFAATTTYTGVYAGGTIAPNDAVVLNNGARITGNVITNGTLQFNQSGTTLTVSSTISGTGTLSLTNTGTLTLLATNTSSETTLPSQTTVSLGRLSIGNSGTGRLLVGGNLSVSGGVVASTDSRLSYTGPDIIVGRTPTGPVAIITATVSSGTWVNSGNLSLTAGSLTGSRLSIMGNGLVAVGGTLSGASFSASFSSTVPPTVITTTGTVDLGLGGTLQIGLGGTTGVLSPSALSAMNGTLAFNRSDSVAYDGAISGSGSVVQMGSGALTLSGNNTYSGTTQVLAGTLVLAGSSASPLRVSSGTLQITSPNAFYGGTTSAWTAQRVNVDNGSTLSLDATTFSTSQISQFASLGTGSTGFKDGSRLGLLVSSGSSTYSYAIADTNAGLNRLGLVKSGSGTLVLTASSSYSGGTYIDSGTLQIGSGGSIQGNVQNNGTLELNRSGTFAVTGSMAGSGNLVVRYGTVSLSGSIAYTGRTEVFDVLRCTTRQSLYGGETTQWTANNIRVSQYAGVRLSVGGANEFTAADVDVIRSLGTGSTGFMNGSWLSFDTTNATSGTFVYSAAIANTNSGSNRLGIDKSGGGVLVLTGSNSYTGGTSVSNGLLQIGNGGSSGSIIGDLYTNNGVIFNRADASVYPGNATLYAGSGTAGLTKLGTGKLTLSGSVQSYADVRVVGGAVEVLQGASITLPTTKTGIAVYIGGSTAQGGTLTVNGGIVSSWINAVGADNTYGVVNMLSGTMNADGQLLNRDKALWSVYNGEMNVSGGFINGSCSVGPAGRLNISGGTIQGGVGGNGPVIMTGGTLMSYSVGLGNSGTGTLSMSGGRWLPDANQTTRATLGQNATGNGAMTLSGGTIGLAYLTVGDAGVGLLNIGGGSLETNRAVIGSGSSSVGTVIAFGGNWLNTGDLIVGGNGAATLKVSGSSGVGGAVIVGGTLSAGGLGQISIENGGTLRIGTGGTTGALSVASVTNHGTLVFNRSSDLNCACVVSGSGSLTKESVGALTLSGASSYSGGTTLNAGSLVAGHLSAFGSGMVVINSGTLNLASLAIANQITNNGGRIINAANYGGTQSVSGVVSMSGTVGGTVSVAATGELKGSGVVFNGPVALASGAQHSPGNSPGIQTFNSGLSYSTGSILNWELITNSGTGAGTNYDFLSVTGGSLSVASGALLNLVFSGSGSTVSWSDLFWNANRSWTIIDALAATSSTGDFTLGTIGNDSLGRSLGSIRPDASFALDQTGNNVVLTFTAVPEPSTYVLALFGLGIGGWAVRRRKLQRAA